MSRLPRARLAALLAALALPACRADAPDAEVAAAVRAAFEPGQVILVRPAWRRPWIEAFEGLPAVAVDDPEAYELGAFDAWWLVEPAPASERARAATRTLEGPRSVARLFAPEAAPAVPRFDLLLHLGEAEVQAGGEACGPWRAPDGRRGLHCRWGEPDWAFVGEVDKELGGRLRRCVWAHPPPAGAPLTLRFPAVPAGELRLRAGMAAPHHRPGAPVTLRVRRGDHTLAEQAFTDGSFAPLSVQLTEPGPLTLEVQAPEHGGRHFCFDGSVR